MIDEFLKIEEEMQGTGTIKIPMKKKKKKMETEKRLNFSVFSTTSISNLPFFFFFLIIEMKIEFLESAAEFDSHIPCRKKSFLKNTALWGIEISKPI